MIAMAKPGQGGTTTVANLAISLAMDGKRVVIVDADMRRPTLHRVFKAKNDFGLSNTLADEKHLFDTPSAIAFTDTVVLSRGIDGVLLVILAAELR